MKELDDVQIYCPQQPHNFAKSVSFPVNKIESQQSKHMPNSEDQADQQKSGQLKPMINQKTTKSRKKVSILKVHKESFQKHPQHRSSQFTKRKPSAKKKMSSVSEDKKPTIDYSEQVIQLLKKQLKEKQKEIKYYRIHLEKLQQITDSINNKNYRNFNTFQSTISFLRSKSQIQIRKAFPMVAKLIDTILTIIQQSVVAINTTMSATQKHSTWSNLYTETPLALDPTYFIKKDIEGLEDKLKNLKQQSTRLKDCHTNAQEILRLKKIAQEQQQQILQLIEMQEKMESPDQLFSKKGISGPEAKLSK